MSVSVTRISLYLQCIYLLLILCIDRSNGHAEKFCGAKLPNTLDLICENGFSRKIKKSIEPTDYYDDMEDELSSSLLEEMPFLSRLAGNTLTKTRRRRHGVYDECCRKPCTIAELKTYCL